MKNFFVSWFVWQILVLSMLGHSGQAERFQSKMSVAKPCEVGPLMAAFVGMIFPITIFDFVEVSFCWEK